MELHWTKTSESMPEDNKPALFCWYNSNGSARVSIGFYISRPEEYSPDYPDEHEYFWCEVNEAYFCPIGWYEESWNHEYWEFVKEEVTHWMPVPDAPKRQEERDSQPRS